MNNFTQLIELTESRGHDSGSLLQSEITDYINKVNKVIPKVVQDVIYITKKYNLLDADSITEIKDSNKPALKRLAEKYSIPLDSLTDLWKQLKDLKSNIRLLPQFQTAQEREALQLGKLSMDDLTIDLDSSAGRNAISKMYMPMVYKIVNQYVGKSKLSKQDLISAGLEGFTNAMNDWKKKSDTGEKVVSFKTYASYRVQQQILNDINKHGHTLSGTSSYSRKTHTAAELDAQSIDGWKKDENGEFSQDHLASLGVTDKTAQEDPSQWDSLFKMIENNFSQRNVDIFYRYFGLHGYKREKSKDIAKSFGMSEGNIRNSVINKIINYLRKDRKAMEILSNIQDAYNEALMVDLIGLPKDMIVESLINDDMFILLEELNRWNNKSVFQNALELSLDKFQLAERTLIEDLLKGDFELLDGSYKKYKKVIIDFLSSMYPSEAMNRKTDVSVLEYMSDLQEVYKKYNK